MSYQLASQPHLVTLAGGQTVQLVQGPMGTQQLVNLPNQQYLVTQVCRSEFDFSLTIFSLGSTLGAEASVLCTSKSITASF